MRHTLSSSNDTKETYKAISDIGWKRVPSWYEIGLKYYMQGDAEKVIDYMSRSLESEPNNYSISH